MSPMPPPPGTMPSSTAARVAYSASSPDHLADRHAKQRIAQRIVRLQSGLMGDVKPVGDGVAELRVDSGPGYRVYFAQRGRVLIILLCGGDKTTQRRDVVRAKKLAAEVEIE